MNNINSTNSSTCLPDIFLQEQSNFKISSLEDHFRVVCEVSQKDRVLLKMNSLAQSIFKFLFQVFECICHYACLLANGLISIKAKLLGVDLHLHFQLFNVIINYGDLSPQSVSPSRILTC
ncbi:hypothetical protein [Candidatus Protochlamydia amoebophila]|uniref:hypothetical protein n=1 Tax=Candidatus Protochlamydia amoebophila TaxID=362787 RepID=UPI001BC919D4|nr:hypothetical protein [Candidatus Protochlamydia amoebophila]